MRSKKEPPNARPWRCRIFSTEDLAQLFGLAPDEAFSAALGPEEVAEALREAGAPEPWQNPAIGVGKIENFTPVGTSRAYREVRTALNKLRRFLPVVIEEFEQELRYMNDRERLPSILRIVHSDHDYLQQFGSLKRQVDELTEEIPLGKRRSAHWHDDAISLLILYWSIVGSEAGASADGPAVRFIQLMLKRLTGEEPEKAAIEAAIRTRRASKEPA